MGYLIDNSATKLGIAEANFNNAHRYLLALEYELKRGRPFEEMEVPYRALKRVVADLPSNYKDAVNDPWRGAEERRPAFREGDPGQDE